MHWLPGTLALPMVIALWCPLSPVGWSAHGCTSGVSSVAAADATDVRVRRRRIGDGRSTSSATSGATRDRRLGCYSPS
ncbi:hypothetical protein C8F04DRAFT_1117607 [Mycena alexandri]|uniref:Secreted protein n=1 Tax=Mycena alexandri TaxID=1745969 RepID=A0AAD6SK42_9AGAR|nr:hypothetical protein C8F04DRAFT_1117607 [Mycena alexandri]